MTEGLSTEGGTAPQDDIEKLLGNSGLTPTELLGLPRAVLESMRILESETHVLAHQRRILKLAEQLFKPLEVHGPVLSGEQQRNVKIASTLCDIGKAGPPIIPPSHITPDQKLAVAQYFAIDNIPAELMAKPVSEILEHFGKAHLVLQLQELDPTLPKMTGWEFRKLHLKWTNEHFVGERGSALPQEAQDAIARHHYLDGYPDEVVSQQLTPVDILVIVLDQYDALRCRGKQAHGEALSSLTDKVRRILGKQARDVVNSVESFMDVLALLDNDNYCEE